MSYADGGVPISSTKGPEPRTKTKPFWVLAEHDLRGCLKIRILNPGTLPQYHAGSWCYAPWVNIGSYKNPRYVMSCEACAILWAISYIEIRDPVKNVHSAVCQYSEDKLLILMSIFVRNKSDSLEADILEYEGPFR